MKELYFFKFEQYEFFDPIGGKRGSFIAGNTQPSPQMKRAITFIFAPGSFQKFTNFINILDWFMFNKAIFVGAPKLNFDLKTKSISI